MLIKVSVIYEFNRKKPKRGWIDILVDAKNHDEAMALAAAAAEDMLPIGPEYTMFEAREASNVQLPYVLRS